MYLLKQFVVSLGNLESANFVGGNVSSIPPNFFALRQWPTIVLALIPALFSNFLLSLKFLYFT